MPAEVQYKTAAVDGLQIFYREGGSPTLPHLLLLHGHGSASHTYRNLIPLLSDAFHVVAPDYPGFGQSSMPSRETYAYTFNHLAETIDHFTETIGLAEKGFAIYVFDFGAPVGYRIACKHPERITGIVSQSGNAYEEGLGEDFAPIQAYWADPHNQTRRDNLRAMFTLETIRDTYTMGVDPSSVGPDAAVLDFYYNNHRPGALEVQLDLQLDYQQNVKAYPQWQKYFREHQPKFVAIWGKDDLFFRPPGAEAYKRDLPNAEVSVVDGAHYLDETIPEKVAAVVKRLLVL